MASKKSSALADEDANVPLQAVVLADSFTQKFRPITMERPKVLLPLVNVPMIDYTLEWLVTAGVKEVFVFCCAHSAQVTLHVDTFWKQQQGFTVTCIVALDCTSAGDALRVIDQKGVVSNNSAEPCSDALFCPALLVNGTVTGALSDPFGFRFGERRHGEQHVVGCCAGGASRATQEGQTRRAHHGAAALPAASYLAPGHLHSLARSFLSMCGG